MTKTAIQVRLSDRGLRALHSIQMLEGTGTTSLFESAIVGEARRRGVAGLTELVEAASAVLASVQATILDPTDEPRTEVDTRALLHLRSALVYFRAINIGDDHAQDYTRHKSVTKQDRTPLGNKWRRHGKEILGRSGPGGS